MKKSLSNIRLFLFYKFNIFCYNIYTRERNERRCGGRRYGSEHRYCIEGDTDPPAASIMNKEEILQTLKSLAQSQGLYGRVLNSLYELTEEERDNILTYLEDQNFKDPVDLVLFIEG